jgi:sarcosine oxidase subunit beta
MYSNLESCKLSYEGYHYWERWTDFIAGHDTETGPVDFVKVPWMTLIEPNAQRFLDNALPHHDTLGISYDLVDACTIKERFPYISLALYGGAKPIDSQDFGEPQGECDRGLICDGPSGFVSDPAGAANNLMKAAQATGGQFQFRACVSDVLKVKGKASGIRLADGSELHAPVVINATGPWSGEFNKLAFAGSCPSDDSKVVTRPMRVEVAYPPAPPDMNFDKNGCIFTDFDNGIYMRPATGGRLTIGSIDPACDHPQHDLESVAEFDDSLGHPWERQMYRAGLRFPGMPLPNTAVGVSHMYDKSDDFTPIYDKTAIPGFYTAIGSSGNQFKNCGIIGHVMADIIEKCENGHDHDADPVQVLLPHTKQILNTGAFSRLRENNTSTGGVIG